ncbi:(2Fe-2S)-binding protein [Candidatus Gracilibacteria bacterium]|nr:(2Fe-2S)-binding protein [Candidatus Gracilibacteria bacterium]
MQKFSKEEADGCGKTADIEVFVKVRKDSQIPAFDAVGDFYFQSEEQSKYNDKVAEMLTEYNGMFLDDVMKLEEKDVFSAMGEDIHAKDRFAIPALRAVKKAIINYFKESDQEDRYRKATDKVICHCKHVTKQEIKEAVEKGKDSFIEVMKSTGCGTGCGSCSRQAREIAEGYIRTGLGSF